jgi:hypothetical protein
MCGGVKVRGLQHINTFFLLAESIDAVQELPGIDPKPLQ